METKKFSNIDFLKLLKSQNLLPQHIEHYRGENFSIINMYDGRPSGAINRGVYTGISEHKETALSKALSEYVERKAYQDGYASKDTSCFTRDSCGFAAFPRYKNIDNPIGIVRSNAYHESLERFVWAKWWDEKSIGATIKQVNIDYFSTSSQMLLNELSGILEIESIFSIQPNFDQKESSVVKIVFAKIKNAGYISGGASATVSESDTAYYRAISELIRHGLAVKRMLDGYKPNRFYEEKLEYFGTGQGNDLVESRLQKTSDRSILLPQLVIDQEIDHRFKSHYIVYRCLFKDQPHFARSGGLQRLVI
ncbi:MAG: hypothetical protein HRU19_31665 [Pseudobacteriovorax sp.]|nr:hypothetical protein [Pseudobacteriovorax sp.]